MNTSFLRSVIVSFISVITLISDRCNSTALELSADIIQKSYFSSFLSHAVYYADEYWKNGSGRFCSEMKQTLDPRTECTVVKHPIGYDVANFKIYTDVQGLRRLQGDDYIVLSKWNDVCYAAWRGTDVDDSYWDAVQNAPAASGFEEMKGPRGSCMVRRGWKYAYDVDYNGAKRGDGSMTDEILDDIRKCTNSCRYGCDLVLTGHSQGGAAAAVAAIALADRNPYLITFGQPGTYKDGKCDVVRASRTYRFMNTAIESYMRYSGWLWENALWYDRFARFFMDDSFGNLIVLNEKNKKLVVYPHGYRDTCSHGHAPKSTFTAHYVEMYQSKIRNIYNSGEHPKIGLNVWQGGQQCYFDSECIGNCVWVDTTKKWWHLPKRGQYQCS